MLTPEQAELLVRLRTDEPIARPDEPLVQWLRDEELCCIIGGFGLLGLTAEGRAILAEHERDAAESRVAELERNQAGAAMKQDAPDAPTGIGPMQIAYGVCGCGDSITGEGGRCGVCASELERNQADLPGALRAWAERQRGLETSAFADCHASYRRMATTISGVMEREASTDVSPTA